MDMNKRLRGEVGRRTAPKSLQGYGPARRQRTSGRVDMQEENRWM